jgi:amphi-Trp domain-containing protein
MAKKTILFKVKEYWTTAEVAAFLRELADRLDQNEVVLRRGSEEVVLSVPRSVVFDLEVEEKAKKGKTKRELEIEIEWQEGGDAAAELTLG